MCVVCRVNDAKKVAAAVRANFCPWVATPLMTYLTLSFLLPARWQNFSSTISVSPKFLLALCVLMVCLGWREVILPKLQLWREKRALEIREMKRLQAAEIARWRKEATRLCRNCTSPYRDQDPPGGRFMCQQCGHVSRKPMLEIPGSRIVVGDKVYQQHATGPAGSEVFRLSSHHHGRCNWTDLCDGAIPHELQSILHIATAGAIQAYHWSTSALLHVHSRLRSWSLGSTGDGAGSRKRREETAGERIARLKRKAEEKKLARIERELEEEEERLQREEVARLVEVQRQARQEEERRAAKQSAGGDASRNQQDGRGKSQGHSRGERKERQEGSGLEKLQKVSAREQNVKNRGHLLSTSASGGEEHHQHAASHPGHQPAASSKGNKSRGTLSVWPHKALGFGRAKVHPHSEQPSNDGRGARCPGEPSPPSQANNRSVGPTAPTTPTAPTGPTGPICQAAVPAVAGAETHQKGGSWKSVVTGSAVPPSSFTPLVDLSSLAPSRHPEAPKQHSHQHAVASRPCAPVSPVLTAAGSSSSMASALLCSPIQAKGPASPADYFETPPCISPAQPLSPTRPLSPPVPPCLSSAVVDHLVQLQPILPPRLNPTALPLVQLGREAPQVDGCSEVPSSTEGLHEDDASGSLAFEGTDLRPTGSLGAIGNGHVSFTLLDPVGNMKAPTFNSPASRVGGGKDARLPSRTEQKWDIWDSLPLMEAIRGVKNGNQDLPPCHGSKGSDSAQEIGGLLKGGLGADPVADAWQGDGEAGSLPDSLSASPAGAAALGYRPWDSLPPQVTAFQTYSSVDAWFLQPGSLPLPSGAYLQEHLPATAYGMQAYSSTAPSFAGTGGTRLAPTPMVYQYHPSMPPAGRPVPSLLPAQGSPCGVPWEQMPPPDVRVPPEFVDCITQEVMVDPVITADGHSYDRSSISAWLRDHDTSPLTGQVLPTVGAAAQGEAVDKTLRPNHALRSQIMEFRDRLAIGMPHSGADQGNSFV